MKATEIIKPDSRQAFEPVEVKVVNIAPQRVICESKSVDIDEYQRFTFEEITG